MEFFSFDADYLRRLEAQDPGTEAHFVAYFTPFLGRKYSRRNVPADIADDLVQETLLRCFESIRQCRIRSPEKLGSFVSKVGDNVYWEYERDQLPQRVDADEIPLLDSSPSPEEALRRNELREAVQKVLDRLPPRDRAILRALFFEERDRDEVCREFKVDRDHLRLLVHRALQKAWKLLRGSGGGSRGKE